MNTLCTRILVLFVVSAGFKANAQGDFEAFSESAFAIRHDFSSIYNANFEASTRAFAYQDSDFIYKTRQVQIGHFSTLKLDLKNSVALGLMFRNRAGFEDSSNEIRLTQQFNRKSILKTLRFGHRLRSEQRFYNQFTTFRFRYRLALDLPLQGLKLDVGETYFVVSNEALWTISKKLQPFLEYRISPTFGLLLTERLNLEFGLELRLDNVIIATEETLFFNTSVELRI